MLYDIHSRESDHRGSAATSGSSYSNIPINASVFNQAHNRTAYSKLVLSQSDTEMCLSAPSHCLRKASRPRGGNMEIMMVLGTVWRWCWYFPHTTMLRYMQYLAQTSTSQIQPQFQPLDPALLSFLPRSLPPSSRPLFPASIHANTNTNPNLILDPNLLGPAIISELTPALRRTEASWARRGYRTNTKVCNRRQSRGRRLTRADGGRV